MPQIIGGTKTQSQRKPAAEQRSPSAFFRKDSCTLLPGAGSVALFPQLAATVEHRLNQTLRLSCQQDRAADLRLLDLSRIGMTSASTAAIIRQIAEYFALPTPEPAQHSGTAPTALHESSVLKIHGLSVSHNPNIGPHGAKCLFLSLTQLVFEAPGSSSSVALCLPRHSLQVLDLYNIGLTDACIPDLLTCIESSAPTLTKIKLGDNSVTARGVLAMVHRPAALRHIQQLHLGGNPLHDEGVQYLAALLVAMRSVTNVGIREVKCSDKGLKAVFEAILHRHEHSCSTDGGSWFALQELQVRGNEMLLPATAAKLSACFSSGAFSCLTVLDMAGCRCPDDGMANIYMTLAHTSHSQHQGNLAGASLLSPSEKAFPQLREADLSGNALGPRAASALRQVLIRNTSLSSLSLSDCIDSSAACFADALDGLRFNTTVCNICLARNDIQLGASLAIAAALQSRSCPVLSLDVTDCNIGSAGICAIFAALSSNTARTKVLQASGNLAGSESVDALVAMLAANTHLTKIHFQDNLIPLAGMTRIAEEIERANATVRQLCFGGQSPAANGLTAAVRNKINQALERNKQLWSTGRAWRSLSLNSLSASGSQSVGMTATVLENNGSPPTGTKDVSYFSSAAQQSAKAPVTVLESLWDLPTLFPSSMHRALTGGPLD
jgi:Ran GTPase-activating protein (RanGAP) involved in mRNA processing and transport